MKKLTYQNVDKEMVESFPELQDAYSKELKFWEGETPGQYNIFGFVFMPFVIGLMNFKQPKLLERIFSFVERMATSEDKKVVELVSAEILERLTDKQEWWTRAKKYMGPKTLELSKETEKWFRV